MVNQSTHIVVLRFSSLGDVAMVVPVLQLLLEQHPTIKVTVVSRPQFRPLFAHLPRSEFYAVDLDREFRGLIGLWRLARRLRHLHPTHIADLHRVLRTHILRPLLRIMLSAVPIQKINKERRQKKKLCKPTPDKQLTQLQSTHGRYAEVFAKLGFPIDLTAEYRPPKFVPQAQFPIRKPAIGVAPFARYSGKVYPARQMHQVIRLLLNRDPNLTVYLFGSPEEATELSVWAQNYKRVHNLAGRFTFEEELGLMQQMKLMITMDSANMHLASLLGVRVISIWGPTHPCLGFYGWRQAAEDALLVDRSLYPTLPCSINGKKMHEDAEGCMCSIEVEEIVEKAELL